MMNASQTKVLDWINREETYSGAGVIVFARELPRKNSEDMVALNVYKPVSGVKASVHLAIFGPLAGWLGATLMSPDQAEELATKLQEMAARARQLRSEAA